MSERTAPAFPRPVLIVAITLATLLVVAVAGLGGYASYSEHQRQQAAEAAATQRREGPLPLAPVPAPQADSAACDQVLNALPQDMLSDGDQVPRREIADPAPTGTVAWGDADHDPITVRCGVDAPAELRPDSQLVDISGVGWLEINEGRDTTWLAADRSVYVALNVPADAGTGPLQDVSRVVRDTLPKDDIFTS